MFMTPAGADARKGRFSFLSPENAEAVAGLAAGRKEDRSSGQVRRATCCCRSLRQETDSTKAPGSFDSGGRRASECGVSHAPRGGPPFPGADAYLSATA